jgi:membrane-bound lytic murein transglycosylase B
MSPVTLARRDFCRRLTLAALAASLPGVAPKSAAAADFADFVAALWPQAEATGVSRATFEAATADLAPEPGVLAKPKAQAEFTITIPAYLASAVTPARVARGQRVAGQHAGPLARAARRHGVPEEIIVAILGVESNFGTATGAADALRVLATLAWKGHRAETFVAEFVDALVMLEKGYASRPQLRGSWAGAMGQPQFMPSAYLKFAESDAGAGSADIWGSTPDAIASIANFLEKSGWVAGLPAIVEVVLPETFDYAAFDLDFSGWRALGVARADGAALPAGGAASLYLPAGAAGPAFLISDNFEVIRQYNTSDAYAMSVAVLAARIAGHEIPRAPWPRIMPLSTAEVREMQQLLTERGFYRGVLDGKLGRSSRNAIHAFQRAEGVQPADGFATRAVLARLKGR